MSLFYWEYFSSKWFLFLFFLWKLLATLKPVCNTSLFLIKIKLFSKPRYRVYLYSVSEKCKVVLVPLWSRSNPPLFPRPPHLHCFQSWGSSPGRRGEPMARFSPEPLLPCTCIAGNTSFYITPCPTSTICGCDYARKKDGKPRREYCCDPQLGVDIDYVSYSVFKSAS